MDLLSVGLGLFSSDKGCWINLVGLEKKCWIKLVEVRKSLNHNNSMTFPNASTKF